MKQGIHPDYHKVVFMDSSTGYKFLSGSTATSDETVEWEDGNTYPLIRVSKSLLKQTGLSIVSTRNTALQTNNWNEKLAKANFFFSRLSSPSELKLS